MSSSQAELTARPPRAEDAEAVAAVMSAFDGHFGVVEESQPEDVRREWRELDLDRDAWIWEEAGTAVAYATVMKQGERFVADGYVRPSHFGRGIGSAIVERTEQRARELGAGPLENAILGNDPAANALLRGCGYRDVRHFYRMRIELDAPPPEPRWPEGFVAEAFDLAHAREFHAALEDAFAAEWGHTPESFDAWSRRRLDAPGFDPTLCTVVRAGDAVAAVLMGDWKRHGDAGWIAAVGVREAWRRRGLGEALLLRAFGEFHRRGERAVQLGVDAENPTGATRLYERVGMSVTFEAVVYVKELA
jgi:mycothiol synthase